MKFILYLKLSVIAENKKKQCYLEIIYTKIKTKQVNKSFTKCKAAYNMKMVKWLLRLN